MSKKPDFSNRNLEIGGSEIAAIMGMSPYETPLSLWAKKTNKIQAELSHFEAAEIGTELEEYVARKFTRKTGIKLRVDNRTFRHPKHPYMVGHIDRWVVGEDALFEAKTCSAWLEKHWQGEDIPPHYVLQVIWYLGLVGKKVGHIAVLIGGQKFVYKQIEFDLLARLQRDLGRLKAVLLQSDGDSPRITACDVVVGPGLDRCDDEQACDKDPSGPDHHFSPLNHIS